MLKPGRVSVFDVSIANDFVKNLVTADLLRKTFAYKIVKAEAPPPEPLSVNVKSASAATRTVCATPRGKARALARRSRPLQAAAFS